MIFQSSNAAGIANAMEIHRRSARFDRCISPQIAQVRRNGTTRSSFE